MGDKINIPKRTDFPEHSLCFLTLIRNPEELVLLNIFDPPRDITSDGFPSHISEEWLALLPTNIFVFIHRFNYLHPWSTRTDILRVRNARVLNDHFLQLTLAFRRGV